MPLPASPETAIALVAGETRLYAIWSEPGAGSSLAAPHVVRFSRYEAGAWSEPVTIAEADGPRREDGTAIFEQDDGVLTACWFEEGESGGGRIARSNDGGATWQASTKLPDDLARADTPREWFATPDGQVGLLWVGPIRTLLWKKDAIDMVLFSSERKSFRDETMLAQWACRACGLSVVPTSRDHLLFSYRATSPSHLLDAGASTVVIHGIDTRGRGTGHSSGYRDGWKVADSPRRYGSGPALATDRHRVVSTWYTELPSPMVKVQISRNAGRSYLTGLQFPTQFPAHHFAAAWENDRTFVLSWIEGASLLARRIDVKGSTGSAIELATLEPGTAARAPWVGRVGDATYVAWRSGTPARTTLVRIR